MKKMGVPVEAITHYCKQNNIIQDKPIMSKINFNANDLLTVKLKPVETEKKETMSIFKPPSVNELLDIKSRLKKIN